MPTRPTTRLVYSTAGSVPETAPEPTTPLPAKGGIRIRLDRRASGRLVTVLTGLAAPASEIDALGAALRSACGAGGTAKDGSIEIQGDHRDKVEAVLAARGLRSKRAGG